MVAERRIHVARVTHWLKHFSQWDGWILVFGGLVVLLGWVFGIEFLKRVFPGFVAMNPATAVGFMIAGISLLSFWQIRSHSRLARFVGRTLAGFLIVLGALKLCEYEFGWHLPFDQIFFPTQVRHETVIQNQIVFPNQMAPNTAFNFLMSGVALWLLNSWPHRFSRFAQNLSLLLLFVSLVPLVGYIYHASYLYSIGSYIPMALHTAILFALLSIGVLLAQPETGVVAVFLSETPGGGAARRLLPFGFGIPFILGALAIFGAKRNFYPAEFGTSIVVVGSFAAFSALIWWNAVSVNRADKKRREAEIHLQKAHDELELRVSERTVSLRQANEALQMQILLQQKAEEKIRQQAKLLDEAKDAILVLDLQQRVTFWNKGAERLYGWTVGEILGKNGNDLLFAGGQPAGVSQIFETGAWSGELPQLTKASQPMIVESSWTLVKDEFGKPQSILIINTNVTEQKNYEAQLLRSQRMESLGALAGGIAHDLNNALAPVIMGADLLLDKLPDTKDRVLLETISASAKRGSEMVKQILTFARGSQGRNALVEIRSLMKEMVKILTDTFPKSMDIQSHLEPKLWTIRGDVTELHQVLLNLCVNARDAMPRGGRIMLAAENVTLKAETLPANPNAAPGSYIMLSVTDTGTGIPPEILPRIFEPFFTTKAPDKGTGLGLSTVSNIVRNHRGFVDVKTQKDKGTSFRVYLPAIMAAEAIQNEPEKPILPTGNGELILIMDDEQAVRALTRTTLETYGYRVVTAANGLLGITCFEQFKDEIAAIISDTDMPLSGGLDAIRSIQQLKPDVRIIIASGGKRDPNIFHDISTKHLTELQKPYTIEQLLNAVADAVKGAQV